MRKQTKALVIVIASAFIIIYLVLVSSIKTKGGSNMNIKTVTELIITPFNYPHPYKLFYVSQYRFVHQIGEYLVRRDNFQNIIGGLAHSWTISKDRKSIVFHLRPNLYKAEEVAQSFRRIISAKQTSHSNLAHQILSEKDIIVLDDLNLKIITAGDSGAILAPLVMADMAILPDDHWINLPGFNEPQVDWTKTKGPYIYESGSLLNIKNKEIIFKPNPNHYFFSKDLLKWKIINIPLNEIPDLTYLKPYFDKEPTFMTVRCWEMLKIFSKTDESIKFYETRPNGISFLTPNKNSKVFSNINARLTLLKRVRKARLPILNQKNKADQIPQPGLSGRIPDDEFNDVLANLDKVTDFEFKESVTWDMPEENEVNKDWIKSLSDAIGIPSKFKPGPFTQPNKAWDNGEYDLMVRSVGMSDTDPISGATFFFSPVSDNLDFPDGRILKLLNSGKDTTNREEITKVVRGAYRMALEGGLMIPLNYVNNRHYYSDTVELNIQDPYSESVRIWEVRLKN